MATAEPVLQIIEQEVFCRCRGCEEAVQTILRMESMLCRGAKAELTRRRMRIQTERRRPYFRERYQAQRVYP